MHLTDQKDHMHYDLDRVSMCSGWQGMLGTAVKAEVSKERATIMGDDSSQEA